MSAFLLLKRMLETRLPRPAVRWFRDACTEITDGVDDTRFAGVIAMASRYARDSTPLAPNADESKRANETLDGWSLERWGLLEALRAALVLTRSDLERDQGALAVESLFAYADEGEQRALYRTLPLLPAAERFAWRGGEGCRTNIPPVFEAVVLDSPFAVRHFDDGTWNQAVIKAVFLGVPLWRLFGLDTRLGPELARMALDLVEERRSARREIQPELWLCMGEHGGARGTESILQELDPSNSHTMGRCAAAYALARAGEGERLVALLENEADARVRAAMQEAVDGDVASTVFRKLRPEEGA